MENYDENRVLAVAKDLILSENLEVDKLIGIALSRSNTNNFWNVLAKKYYGHTSKYPSENYKKSQKLKQWLTRGAKNPRMNSLKALLINDNKVYINSMISVEVRLTWNEWNEKYNLFCSSSTNGRTYFTCGFSKFLTLKLQTIGFKCSITSEYNYFQKKHSRKESSYWTGKYFCECGKKFIFTIRNEISFQKNDVIIVLNHDPSVNNHQNILEKKFQCRGKEREIEGLILSSKGVQNRKSENVVSNNETGFKSKIPIFLLINLLFSLLQHHPIKFIIKADERKYHPKIKN